MALTAMPVRAANTTGTAKAVIVKNLSFFDVEDLEFGAFLSGATAGTVVVTPANVRTATGGVTLVGGPVSQPARFAGKGTINQLVAISMQSTPTTITRVGGTQTMIVETYVIGSTPTAVLTTVPRNFRITGVAGIFNFPIGATLRVNANQTPGDYVGTFSLTLNYL
jgi:Domain of unknown function (DUF4402)